MKKKHLLFILLISFSGCSAVIKSLDAGLVDDQTVYDKSQTLPFLEIPLELSKTEH